MLAALSGYSLSPGRETASVEAEKAMVRILRESEAHCFDGIATDHDCWFRYFYQCSKMYWMIARTGHSEDVSGDRREVNYDHDILHRMETNHSRFVPKCIKLISYISSTTVFRI
jgi:hypothetical protein